MLRLLGFVEEYFSNKIFKNGIDHGSGHKMGMLYQRCDINSASINVIKGKFIIIME